MRASLRCRLVSVNRNILTLQRISAMLGPFHGPQHDGVRTGGGQRRVDRRHGRSTVGQSTPPRRRATPAALASRPRARRASARAEPARARPHRYRRAAHAAGRRRHAAGPGRRRPGARVRRARPRARHGARPRLRALLAETGIDQPRIVTEAAVWADKSDVTEELARLRAHLAEFTLMLGKDGPVGRPLDFLIQELNREINTVASKADDLEMSQA